MEPEVIRDKDTMRKWSRLMRLQGRIIGLVPTMGYLHNGHLSLVRQSLNLADVTVVSIYVNPGQFSPTEDLSTYPSDFSGDLAELAALSDGKVVVFNPKNLYDYDGDNEDEKRKLKKRNSGDSMVSCVEEDGVGHETWVWVERLEKGLYGKSRLVFFRGVATIVTKLFNIVEPDVAMFGKKDYQQWRLIQKMVRDLDFGIEIVGSDIAREKDGLAMSSRNVRLSDEERQRIVDQQTLEGVEEIKSGVVICVAAWFGTVRLIDNIEINVSL